MSKQEAENSPSKSSYELIGCLLVILSALLFYFATVPVKLADLHGLAVEPIDFVHARFFIGFILLSAFFIIRKKRPVINERKFLFGRAFSNVVATWCFFEGVKATGTAEANILNMTYPVFVVLIAVIFRISQAEFSKIALSVISWIGIALVMYRDSLAFPVESMWGLASGFLGGIAILCLNFTRQKNDTSVVLLFMFGCGMAVLELAFGSLLKMPQGDEWYYLIATGTLGFLAQLSITFAFRYVTAIEGSILGTSRIVIAAVLGPIVASDPELSLVGWSGALLIIISNIFLAYKKSTLIKPPLAA